MTDKKRMKDSARASAAPFFARYLESQEADGQEDAEASVSNTKARANADAKAGGKTKAAAAAKPIPAQTLKYPSDRDEWVLYPYHVEAATVKPGTKRQTLKYPSDNDEGDAYYPVYVNEADVPKTATAKPKDAKVQLTRKPPKGGAKK